MMITSGEEDGEEVRLSKEAVLHMFQKCEDSSKEEQIVVEMMEKSKADEIFDELQRRYPRSYVEDDNGRMHFLRNLNGSYNKSFRVLTTYR
uniref:Uncharacterized protein n=1 Tax=Caenorhabditis japonica TaxID=281687 RepID=A0A8R1EKV5_CAEJA